MPGTRPSLQPNHPTAPGDDAGTRLATRVERLLLGTPILDIHTHLYDPAFGSLLLSGIDELLIYHYLVSESFRQFHVPAETFWKASKSEQATWIWNALFLDRSPVSEACRGILTTLHAFGLDPRKRDLESLRRWFAERNPTAHVDQVLALAGVEAVFMTNSPFDPEERPYWEEPKHRDPRFRGALRIDPLLLQWPATAGTLRAEGWDVSVDRCAATAAGIRRFLDHWSRRFGAAYCMVSLPPDFAHPSDSDASWILENAVLPHCRESGMPLALMMGVRRSVNPVLRLAGDGVGQSRLDSLQHLCAAHPANRFLATCLSRENQHELAVLARKFPNLHPFGCWWFTNTPQLAEEITTLRLELLGTSFTPQHSDARVLDQLIYKWRHFRAVLARCLTRKYADLERAGWAASDADIQRDAAELLGGGFRQFCRRP